ncbi:MAG: Na+/H+ antiporter subunit E [Chloroflexota bacterium]
MISLLSRAAGLTAIYLLVLTSLDPGDILIGGVLGLGLVLALRARPAPDRAQRSRAWLPAAAGVVWQTFVEMVIGSWRVVRLCLGGPARPGFVEIPMGERSRANVALWGVLTGEAPDEVPIDVDEERGLLIVHLVDASDPDGIRARHRAAFERWQRHVVA